MRRVLVPPSAVAHDCVTVADPEALHHLLRVVRVKVGDRLECFDGRGRAYAGPIVRCQRRALTVAIDAHREEAAARPRLTLAQGAIQPQRFDWLVQKTTELGVAEIIPVLTSRTRQREADPTGGSRLARWRRIAEEAAGQCGRSTVPTVRPPQAFESLAGSLRGRRAVMLTLAAPGRPLEQAVADLRETEEAVLLVGPEGDFSPGEVTLAERHGARVVRLRGATLRAETAAVATLAILQHRVGML